MNLHLGELAALGTSIAFAIGPLFMERAVKQTSVMAVNAFKFAFGFLYLSLLAFFVQGQFFPQQVPLLTLLFLSASGIVGLVAGDFFLLHAFRLIGARLAILITSLSVPLSALIGFILYNENPGLIKFLGITLSTLGILITVTTGKAKVSVINKTDYKKGIIFGILSALFTVIAIFLTKASVGGVDKIGATQIRIGSAFIGFLLFSLFAKKHIELKQAFLDMHSLTLIAIASIFGPFIGMGLQLYAIQTTSAGIATALSSLAPVFIILPSWLINKKKIAPLEIVGALIATIGTLLLIG